MAYRLSGSSSCSAPQLTYCPQEPHEQTSVQLENITMVFIPDNAFEYAVCEMVAVLVQT